MKNDRVIKQLLEMLDLDSSEYVRLMVGIQTCLVILSFSYIIIIINIYIYILITI